MHIITWNNHLKLANTELGRMGCFLRVDERWSGNNQMSFQRLSYKDHDVIYLGPHLSMGELTYLYDKRQIIFCYYKGITMGSDHMSIYDGRTLLLINNRVQFEHHEKEVRTGIAV